jgi:hypothetical protein
VAHYLSYIFCIALLSLLTLTTAHNIRNPLSQPLDLDLLTSIEQQDMTTHTSDESIFDRKTFLQTRLGRLPIKLLQNVTRHLNKHDLAAVARSSPELRALAERQLYPDIHLPYVAEDYGKRGGDHMEHWPLCQTLSLRPDLAQRVSSMDIIAQDVQHDVEVPSMQLLPGQVYFPATFHIEIPQGTVTGMLLQRLPNLEHLDLTLPLLYDPRRKYKNEDMEVYLPGYEDDLLPQAMRTLFPSFDPQTAHLADPPLLLNIEILHYIGDEIH